jgi:hypothetical protein
MAPRRILPFALLGLLVPSLAGATVVRWLSLDQKTLTSPVVVHGFIERVEVEWEVEGAKTRTVATVRVEEAIKGDFQKGERFLMRRGGGTIGDFNQTAPGLSTYEPGEEVVLFLEPYGPYLVEVGIGIGKYEVSSDGRNKWVTHAPKVSALKKDGDKPARITEIQPMAPERLEHFLKMVRSYARGLPTDPIPQPRKGASLKAPPSLPVRQAN